MSVQEISVEELVALAQANGGRVPLVDVREPDEWEDSHIEWASHVPLGQVADTLDAFGPDDSDQTVYVICKAGGRSMQACAHLAARNKNVVNVAGGMLDWWEAGHPTVSGS